MKLRLPLILQAAVLSACALVPSLALGYDNPALTESDHVKGNGNGGVFSSSSVSWGYSSYAGLTFSNNSAQYGGVAWLDYNYSRNNDFSFTSNGDILFSGNIATGTSAVKGGGALGGDGGSVLFQYNQDVKFVDNKATGAKSSGGALFIVGGANASSVIFDNNQDISFTGNEADAQGGAIFSDNYVSNTIFSNNNSLSFVGNKTLGDADSSAGGAIFTRKYLRFENNGNITFDGNITNGLAGGAYSFGGFIIRDNKEILVQNNTAREQVSALGSGYVLILSGNGNVSFLNNKTLGEGAALYVTLQAVQGQSFSALLSADKGDITFDGNLQNTGEGLTSSRLGFVASGMAGQTSEVDFRADQGHSINFYDAFYVTKLVGSGASSTAISLAINNYGNSGEILISGEKNEGKVLESLVSGNVSLNAGTLQIKENAQLSLVDVTSTGTGKGHTIARDTKYAFKADNGSVLEMRKNGAMFAGAVSIGGPRTTLRTGSGANLTADSVNMQYGVGFDLLPFVDSSIEKSGLSITTGSWTLGGNILLDNNLMAGISGDDDRWATNQDYVLLTDVSGTRSGQDFSKIGLLLGNQYTNVVEGAQYAYNGTWSYEWVGNDLVAHWTVSKVERAELWWDGNGTGSGNGIGVWNQTSTNKVWNKDAPDGEDWAFEDYDVVHFTRSGDVTIQGLIEFGGNVNPFGRIEVAFGNGNGELVWHGSGSVVGKSYIEKFGTGTLVIKNENTFSGGTILRNGTIRLDGSLTGLGTGDVTIHGGLLDLGDQGATNNVVVVGNGALAGIAEGNVLVKTDATLNFLGGTYYLGAKIESDLSLRPVLVEDKGTVNVQAGNNFAGHIELKGDDSAVNFVEGNGGTSLFSGSICGNGKINVIGGDHVALDAFDHGIDEFTGTLTMIGGKMTLSSPRTFSGAVNLLGGTLIAGANVRIGTVTVGNTASDKVFATVGVTPTHSDASKDFLWANSLDVKKNATLYVIGALNVSATSHVQSGGMIEMQNGSVLKTMGMLTSDNRDEALSSGGVVINNECTWNANGGFEVYYIDARTGFLTIGSDSRIKENGYFYAENVVYGTYATGELIKDEDVNNPDVHLPVLTIEKGATFWAGNTIKHAWEDNTDTDHKWQYETITGFHNVQLRIEDLATIGTFVVKGDGDGNVTHDGIVDSMKRAFADSYVEGTVDSRNYLYVLKQGINFNTGTREIQSNEGLHVDAGATAQVGSTAGAVVNLGGGLNVDHITISTGSVTASGGRTNLVNATRDRINPLFLGSFGTESTKETTAPIRINENAGNQSIVKVDTVQAQTGEKTVIGSTSEVDARNFIIAGAETSLDNRGGALLVEEEVTLKETATYIAGDKDRFGWVNMNEGNLNLVRSSWKGITLGSYSASSADTAAKVRLDENKANNVEANQLHVATGNEHTTVNAETTVDAKTLLADQGSFLDVKQGGTVNVHEALAYASGVSQTGSIQLTTAKGADLPANVYVSFAGENHVGTLDSSTAAATFSHRGFNNMEGYNNQGRDTWVFVLTDDMLNNQNEGNALSKIAAQNGNDLSHIALDTSKLTESYFGDIQVYSDNITLHCEESNIDYGEATGTYNNKDAIKNFVFINPVVDDVNDLTINSLWTMVDAMDAMASAIYGQLNFDVYRQTPRRNLWAKALYMNENIGNALPGYRKDTWGYAVGSDRNIGRDSILGIGFGQMLGTEMTNRGMGKDRQNIMMGMVYGRTILESCPKGATTLDYMFGYGWGDNRGRFYRNGECSTGNWNSDVYYGSVRSTWYRKVSETVSLNPYVGGEFVFAQHDAHSIRGGAGNFEVGRSRTHSLRMPIGATVEWKSLTKGEASLTNYIGASYVPDLLRSNPKATVVNGMLNRTVEDTHVGRHAIRAYTGATWQINRDWLVNLNYQVEAASRKVNQTATVSTNYSF